MVNNIANFKIFLLNIFKISTSMFFYKNYLKSIFLVVAMLLNFLFVAFIEFIFL
jgi:hypothetical protein